MDPIVKDQAALLAGICHQRQVVQLALFGSAATGRFDPQRSDLDFVVQFASMSPHEHADAFFGLIDDLQRLFQRPIDLVEWNIIQNPYFKQSVENTQIMLYEAA